MKRILYISALMGLLASCNPYKSHIPEQYIGCWFNQDNGHWTYGLFEESVIYKNNRWDYQSVEPTADGLNLTLTCDTEQVSLNVAFDNDSTLAVTENGKTKKLCWKMDVLMRNKAKNVADRDTSTYNLEQTTVGYAVIRTYVRNDMSKSRYLISRTDNSGNGYYGNLFVCYNNRLGEWSTKMTYVESDDHYGRLYEAKIPVVNMAEFYISPFASDFWDNLHLTVGQGDTILVMKNGWLCDVAMGTDNNLCANYMALILKEHPKDHICDTPFNLDYIKRSPINIGYSDDYVDNKLNYNTFVKREKEAYEAVAKNIKNAFDSLNVPVSEKYRRYVQNSLDYSRANTLLCLCECTDSVIKNTSLADNDIMQSKMAFDYAKNVMFRRRADYSFDSLCNLLGIRVWGNNSASYEKFIFRTEIYENHYDLAKELGLSRNFADMALTSSVVSLNPNQGRCLFYTDSTKNSMHYTRCEYIRLMTFKYYSNSLGGRTVSMLNEFKQYYEFVHANIANNEYKSVLEQWNNECKPLKPYFEKVFKGKSLTADDIWQYGLLTDNLAWSTFCNLTKYGNFMEDNLTLPIIVVSITLNGDKFNGWYYLFDNEDRTVCIDTVKRNNINRAFFYEKVKPQKHYSVYYETDSRKGELVKLSDDIYIKDSTTKVYIYYGD